jgi:putative peptidoglycan lipid II flippase
MYKGVEYLRIGLNRLLVFFKMDRQIHVHLLVLVNILLAGVAFLKDILLARYFGTSHQADSLYLAFFLPDTVGNSLLAVAIGITCVPVFTRAAKSGIKPQQNEIVNKVLVITLISSCFFLLALLPIANWFFTHFSQGIFSSELNFTYHYFLIMLPIVILSPVAIIAASILQVSGQFTKPAVMPVILNLVLLLTVLVCIYFEYPLFMGGYVYSGAILISTLLVFVFTWAIVLKTKEFSLKSSLNPRFLFKDNNDEIQLFIKLLLPYFCILLTQQIIFLVERVSASTLEIGTISGMTYAYRISQFPIWVFIAAINTVLLPTISKLKEDTNNKKLKKELTQSFILVILISSSISFLFYFLGDWFISLLFLQGAFNEDSLRITNDIFTGYALSILGQSIYLFCLRYFVAFGRMKIPFLISIIGCIFHILLIYYLVPIMGAKGIGYAAAIGYSLTGACILFFLYRDFHEWSKKGGLRSDE